MYCFKCGEKVSDDSKFCENCGANLEEKTTKKKEEGKLDEAVKKSEEVINKGVDVTEKLVKEGVKKTKEVAKKAKEQMPVVKENLSKVDKTIFAKLPPSFQKHKKLVYGLTIGLVVFLILVCFLIWFFFGRGYSRNAQEVRKWQSYVLEDQHVTLGETVDYMLVGERWQDMMYQGSPAVLVTGRMREDGDQVKMIFYADWHNHDSIFAYYEVNGNQRTALDIAFELTEYADDASDALGRD